MSGGNIYIDPDSVSHLSSQILMTADHLDALRQKIVPQVEEVISMSYPSIHEMPHVAHSLYTSQESIESFNYHTQKIVDDLRTTSVKLKQVAEAGWNMNNILLRQATTFGVEATGQGTASRLIDTEMSIPDWVTKLPSDLNTILGTSGTLAKYLALTKELKDNHLLRDLDGAFKNPIVTLLLIELGYVSDVASSDTIDQKTEASDAIGALIGAGVNLIPYADLVMLYFTIIQVGTGISGSIQGWIASRYTSDHALHDALKTTADDLTTTSKNANIGKVFDDVGSVIYDFGSARADTGKDTAILLNDTSNALNSINQAKVNVLAADAEDINLGLNFLIQNSTLPPSWKSTSQLASTTVVKQVSGVADYLTKHPVILSLIPSVL